MIARVRLQNYRSFANGNRVAFARWIAAPHVTDAFLSAIINPVRSSRDVHLRVDRLRADYELTQAAEIAPDGSGFSSLLAT